MSDYERRETNGVRTSRGLYEGRWEVFAGLFPVGEAPSQDNCLAFRVIECASEEEAREIVERAHNRDLSVWEVGQ